MGPGHGLVSLLGLVFHWAPVPHGARIEPALSWIGVIVLTFAAIVPCAPVKILVAGLIAVSMNPVGMFIAKARGFWDFGPTSNVLLMHYPDYLLVGISVAWERSGGQVTTCWLVTRQSS